MVACTAAPPTVRPPAQPPHGVFLAEETEFKPVTAFWGRYAVDSLNVVIHLDSVRVINADTRRADYLGGFAAGLGHTARGGGWTIAQRSPFKVVDQYVGPGDTLRLGSIILSVPRTRIADIRHTWLVFEVALGDLLGRSDTEPMGYGYTHGNRSQFVDMVVPAAAPGTAAGPEGKDEELELLYCPVGEYPEQLEGSGRKERFAVTFVVDTLGRVELGTLSIPAGVHPAFTAAVRKALSQCRFKPAGVDGRLVRSHAVQNMRFVP